MVLCCAVAKKTLHPIVPSQMHWLSVVHALVLYTEAVRDQRVSAFPWPRAEVDPGDLLNCRCPCNLRCAFRMPSQHPILTLTALCWG